MLAAIHIQLIVGTIFIILYSVTILGLVLVIITENRNPLKTIPWVIVLLLAPGIGLLFYFFFGQDKHRFAERGVYRVGKFLLRKIVEIIYADVDLLV